MKRDVACHTVSLSGLAGIVERGKRVGCYTLGGREPSTRQDSMFTRVFWGPTRQEGVRNRQYTRQDFKEQRDAARLESGESVLELVLHY